MGSFVQTVTHDNHSAFLERLHSQYAKFLDKLPTFTYYYTLNRIMSRTDTGLQNVERLTGNNAPTKYNLIRDFPLFGIEQIQLDLQDDDEAGFDTSYQGEAILLPNSVQPMPDDMFWLTAVGRHFLFRVTEVAYDTIAHHNYYKISFEIREADAETEIQNIEQTQIAKKFQCIYDNYGTQEAWIIEDESYNEINALNALYERVTENFLDCFYNRRYNCLLVKDPNGYSYIYDLYVNHFCNEQHIFSYNSQNLGNKQFYVEFPPDFKFLYKGHSIQSVIINKDLELLQSPRFMKYYDPMPTFTDSIFQYYGDFDTKGIRITDRKFNPFGERLFSALPEKFIDNLISGHVEEVNLMQDVIIQYMHDNMDSVGTLLSNYSSKFCIRPTYTDMVLTPLFLYVILQYKSYLTSSNITS